MQAHSDSTEIPADAHLHEHQPRLPLSYDPCSLSSYPC